MAPRALTPQPQLPGSVMRKMPAGGFLSSPWKLRFERLGQGQKRLREKFVSCNINDSSSPSLFPVSSGQEGRKLLRLWKGLRSDAKKVSLDSQDGGLDEAVESLQVHWFFCSEVPSSSQLISDSDYLAPFLFWDII